MSRDAIEQVRDAYISAVGQPPVGVWSAPGRVNLIGEHTDYNAGLCLPIALPDRTYAAAGPRDDERVRVLSLAEGLGEPGVEVALDEISAEQPGGWAAYAAGVVWALRAQGHEVGGVNVVLASTVPVGAGLSSSAALTCSVAAAVSDVFGLGLLEHERGRRELVAAAIRAENEIAGAPTGGMDQTAAMLSQEGQALRMDFRSGEVSAVPVDFAAAGLALLVCDTRAEHALNDGQYAQRRASCERAAAVLGVSSLREIAILDLPTVVWQVDEADAPRVHHVVTEIGRVDDCVDALAAGDFAEVGRLFAASHRSLRDDYEVSCAELDAVVEESMLAGALGARMTGGGFGGSAIALVEADQVDSVTAAIESRFAREGWDAPNCFAVTAGPAARRDA